MSGDTWETRAKYALDDCGDLDQGMCSECCARLARLAFEEGLLEGLRAAARRHSLNHIPPRVSDRLVTCPTCSGSGAIPRHKKGD